MQQPKPAPRPMQNPPPVGQGMEPKLTKIADLRPYMKGVNCMFIVLEKGAVTKTKDEHTISHCLVADGSASIHLSLWDTQGDSLFPSDIIRLSGGYCTLFKNSLILYSGRYGSLERVGEFTMLFNEVPNMSLLSWAPDPMNPKQLIPLPPQAQGNNPAATQGFPVQRS